MEEDKVSEQWIMFRLHKWKSKDSVIKFLHQYEKHIACFEEASRYHVQGVVKIVKKRKVLKKTYINEFRKKIQESQDLHGQTDYALKLYEYNDEAKFDYFCKGGGKKEPPELWVNNVYPLENDVRLAHQRYWEKNAELKRTDGKKKWHKIKEYELPEEIEEKYYREPQRLWYIRIVMYHDENDLLIPDDYQIKKMIKTYMIKDIGDKEQKLKYVASLSKHFMENCY